MQNAYGNTCRNSYEKHAEINTERHAKMACGIKTEKHEKMTCGNKNGKA